MMDKNHSRTYEMSDCTEKFDYDISISDGGLDARNLGWVKIPTGNLTGFLRPFCFQLSKEFGGYIPSCF